VHDAHRAARECQAATVHDAHHQAARECQVAAVHDAHHQAARECQVAVHEYQAAECVSPAAAYARPAA